MLQMAELARVKQTPSYTGRYLDSVADIILNALFLISIWYITDTPIWIFFLAFIGFAITRHTLQLLLRYFKK